MTAPMDDAALQPSRYSEFLGRVIEEFNLNTQDPFTRLLAGCFAFQDQRDSLQKAVELATEQNAALRSDNAKLRERVAAKDALIEQITESECDKVMAMTDEQVRALSAIQGSSADIDALTAKVAVTKAMMRFQTTRAERAEAEVAALRQDAARYRWLRDGVECNVIFTEPEYEDRYAHCESLLCRDDLDAAIDAALAAKAGE